MLYIYISFKELKVLWKASGILGGGHSIYGSRLFKIIISGSFSCQHETMLKFNMLGQESAKAYIPQVYSFLFLVSCKRTGNQTSPSRAASLHLWMLHMAFKDLLALAARYAGGWSALLAGRQGLLDTSLPKVPRSTAAQDSLVQHGSRFAKHLIS